MLPRAESTVATGASPRAGARESGVHAQLPVALAVFAILTEPGLAGAQSPGAPSVERPGPPEPGIVFRRLSPGDRIVARALYADQLASPRALSAGLWPLDEIVRRKAAGYRWGQIFDRMKAAGLVRARTLGELVSEHHQPSPAYSPSFPSALLPGDAGNLVGAGKAASIRAGVSGCSAASIAPARGRPSDGTAKADTKTHLAGGLVSPPGSPGASIDPGAVLPGIHLIHCSEGKASAKTP